MPRPANVTDEDLSQWAREHQEALRDDATSVLLAQFVQSKRLLDMYCSGAWLGRELRALGLGVQEVQALCFANGQRAVYSVDVWQTAAESLERFRRGDRSDIDTPPHELAAHLHKEGMSKMSFDEFLRTLSGGKDHA